MSVRSTIGKRGQEVGEEAITELETTDIPEKLSVQLTDPCLANMPDEYNTLSEKQQADAIRACKAEVLEGTARLIKQRLI